MRFIKIITILLEIFSPLYCFSLTLGGAGSSGGGNAVVCFDNDQIANRVKQTHQVLDGDLDRITEITILELYQLSENKKRQVIPIKNDESLNDYILRLARHHLHFVSPELGFNLYLGFRNDHVRALGSWERKGKDALKDFQKEFIIEKNSPLAFSGDLGKAVFIEDPMCAIVTIVNHIARLDLLDLNYTSDGQFIGYPGLPFPPIPDRNLILEVDSRLFLHHLHSRLSRGWAYLHELAYNELKGTDHEGNSKIISSEKVRELVTLIGVYPANTTVNQVVDKINQLVEEFSDIRYKSYVENLLTSEVPNMLYDEIKLLWQDSLWQSLKADFDRANRLLTKFEVQRYFYSSDDSSEPSRVERQLCPESKSISKHDWMRCHQGLKRIANRDWRKYRNRYSKKGWIRSKHRQEARELIDRITRKSLESIGTTHSRALEYWRSDLSQHISILLSPTKINQNTRVMEEVNRYVEGELRRVFLLHLKDRIEETENVQDSSDLSFLFASPSFFSLNSRKDRIYRFAPISRELKSLSDYRAPEKPGKHRERFEQLEPPTARKSTQ